jgi:DinB superfamily
VDVALDIEDLQDQLAAAERDARVLVADLAEAQGGWHAESGSWSVAQCLDHLAITNRAYLLAMKEPAIRAREQGRFRRSTATPGLVGRWFVRTLEPPVKAPFKIKSPRSVEPRVSLSLANAFASFATTQDELRKFLGTYAVLDLAGVRFSNPFVRGIRFSLATGLHVITAHERRHLCQAWRVRRAAERATAELSRVEDSITKAELM